MLELQADKLYRAKKPFFARIRTHTPAPGQPFLAKLVPKDTKILVVECHSKRLSAPFRDGRIYRMWDIVCDEGPLMCREDELLFSLEEW